MFVVIVTFIRSIKMYHLFSVNSSQRLSPIIQIFSMR
jgi:hypothetical protein